MLGFSIQLMRPTPTQAGEIRFEVKWEGYGYDQTTMEPEANLYVHPNVFPYTLTKTRRGVTVFQEYRRKNPISLDSVTPSPREAEGDQLGVVQALDTETSHAKPAGTAGTDFKPPAGSWEKSVRKIDACEDNDGSVKVYLTWEGGEKTVHALGQVYKRCPQKVRDTKQSFPAYYICPC
jgi:chromobox protein 1